MTARGFTYGPEFDAENPEVAYGRCDGCGQLRLCLAGYACPATCGGACGTEGCTAVIALCGTCGPSPRLYTAGS